MQEELEFWEGCLNSYEEILRLYPHKKFLCNCILFKNRWRSPKTQGEIYKLALEFLQTSTDYKGIQVGGNLYLFIGPVSGIEVEIRIKFLNFIIQKLKCS